MELGYAFFGVGVVLLTLWIERARRAQRRDSSRKSIARVATAMVLLGAGGLIVHTVVGGGTLLISSLTLVFLAVTVLLAVGVLDTFSQPR